MVTGDSARYVGIAPGKLSTLADWVALVAPDDRERVREQFDGAPVAPISRKLDVYRVIATNAVTLDATDEARAIRDHDGALHRVVGIVRFGAGRARARPTMRDRMNEAATLDRPAARRRRRLRRSPPMASS